MPSSTARLLASKDSAELSQALQADANGPDAKLLALVWSL